MRITIASLQGLPLGISAIQINVCAVIFRQINMETYRVITFFILFIKILCISSESCSFTDILFVMLWYRFILLYLNKYTITNVYI